MIALYELHPLSGLQGGFLGNQETTELRPWVYGAGGGGMSGGDLRPPSHVICIKEP